MMLRPNVRAMEHFTEYGLICNQSPEAAVHGILMLRHDREITTSMLGCFRGSIDEFALLHREMDVPYYSLPLEERVEVAIGLTRYGLQNDPELIRTALGPGPIPAEAIKHKTKNGKTLLHGVAYALGENMCPGDRNRGTLPSRSPRLSIRSFSQSSQLARLAGVSNGIGRGRCRPSRLVGQTHRSSCLLDAAALSFRRFIRLSPLLA
jgi:hypothetical protein